MVDLVVTVGPDGWITLDGIMKDTTMTAETSPFNLTYGELKLTDDAATINVTLLIPVENVTQIPLNSATYSMLMDYSQGLLDTNFTAIIASKQVLALAIDDPEALEMVEYFLNSTDFVLDGDYMGGDIDVMVHHTIVANLTDLIGTLLSTTIGLEVPFTLGLTYSKGEYDGSVGLVLLPGLPIEDLGIDIAGNLTDICFNGTIDVTYGDYSWINPSLGEINETLLDELEFYAENIFNASIDVEGSLLNMSMGRVECSSINIERVLDEGGEVITFEVCIGEAMPGVFVFAPFYLLPPEVWEQEEQALQFMWMYFALNNTLFQLQDAEFQLVYTPADTTLDLTLDGTLHVIDLVEQLLEPIAISEEWQTWGLPPELNSTVLPLNWFALEMFNVSASALESSALHMAYLHDDRKVEINVTSLVNMESLDEDLSQLLLELPPELLTYLELPPDYTAVLEPLFTTRLAEITTLQASITYANGEARILVDLTLEGDINAEMNYVKNEIIQFLSQTTPLPWQVQYLNDTTIDVTGIECTVTMDDLSTEIEVVDLAVQPPLDLINATAFKLDRFFNLTGDEAFPVQGARLGVTVIGGSNTTHKVTLYNGTGVSNPDSVEVDADDQPTLMSWDNVTLTGLRELQFLIINLPPTAVTLTTPGQDDVTGTSILLSWSENEDPDFSRYEIFQSTSPDVLGTSIANITDRETVSYRVTGLASDTSYYFTIRVIDDVGLFTDSSQVSATTQLPIWMQAWFIPSIIGIIGVAIVAVFLLRRRGMSLPS
jgi:hypothetical protein